MNHSARQNGPFCDVKWLILKNSVIHSSILYELFTVSRPFSFLESKFFLHLFWVTFSDKKCTETTVLRTHNLSRKDKTRAQKSVRPFPFSTGFVKHDRSECNDEVQQNNNKQEQSFQPHPHQQSQDTEYYAQKKSQYSIHCQSIRWHFGHLTTAKHIPDQGNKQQHGDQHTPQVLSFKDKHST